MGEEPIDMHLCPPLHRLYLRCEKRLEKLTEDKSIRVRGVRLRSLQFRAANKGRELRWELNEMCEVFWSRTDWGTLKQPKSGQSHGDLIGERDRLACKCSLPQSPLLALQCGLHQLLIWHSKG